MCVYIYVYIYIFIYAHIHTPEPFFNGFADDPGKVCVENLRITRGRAKPARVVLRFSTVFLGLHPNHPGFHPGRLSTLYIYIYIAIYLSKHIKTY